MSREKDTRQLRTDWSVVLIPSRLLWNTDHWAGWHVRGCQGRYIVVSQESLTDLGGRTASPCSWKSRAFTRWERDSDSVLESAGGSLKVKSARHVRLKWDWPYIVSKQWLWDRTIELCVVCQSVKSPGFIRYYSDSPCLQSLPSWQLLFIS